MRRSLFGAMAAMMLISSCTAEPGTPSAETTTASATETTSTSRGPQRPRAISLEGKDACALLTAEQLAALKMDTRGRPRESDTYQATGCNWSVTGATGGLVPVTKEGIEVWTEGKRTGRPTEIDPILGFPAITVTDQSDELRCDVMVDTADGQYLTAGYQVSPSFTDRFPDPCEGARQFAEAAMQNLVK